MMKKLICIIICIFALLPYLYGCNSYADRAADIPETSLKMYNIGKKALDYADCFITERMSAQDAYNKIRDLSDDADKAEKKSLDKRFYNDIEISSAVSTLELLLWNPAHSDGSFSMNEFSFARDELAECLGMGRKFSEGTPKPAELDPLTAAEVKDEIQSQIDPKYGATASVLGNADQVTISVIYPKVDRSVLRALPETEIVLLTPVILNAVEKKHLENVFVTFSFTEDLSSDNPYYMPNPALTATTITLNSTDFEHWNIYSALLSITKFNVPTENIAEELME